MRECEDTQILLDAFVDDELLSSEVATVQRHLDSCPTCAGLLEDLLVMKQGLKELPRDELPAHLKARVLERLEGEGREPKSLFKGRFGWSLGLGAAAAALVVVAVVWGGKALGPKEPMYSSLVTDHQHKLSPTASSDMMSKDPKALANWLNGHASFSIPETLVARQKFELMGGRVTKMNGEEMVSIRYEVSKESTTLHVMGASYPMPRTAKKEMVKGMPLYVDRHGGYNIVMWKEGGLLVCAVSALRKDSLLEMIADTQPGKPLEI